MPLVGVIGLGYVGLSLVEAFSYKYSVVGFDISEKRVDELKRGFDKTNELSKDALLRFLKKGNVFSSSEEDLRSCKFFIIAVPTPIDIYRRPDITCLLQASSSVARCLKEGDIVIYESTVYPGCTEEDCVPVLERVSGLEFNKDFFCGYSPERISPGDKQRTIKNIVKVTSGSTPKISEKIDLLYKSVITAGTYLAPSIKVAEAAKVIENTQRDVNISFVNELALICDRMDLDTTEVLNAAATKWNFLPFRPGLVGGHCISVDPFYLTYKAEQLGYNPRVIHSGRAVNDGLATFVVSKIVKLMIKYDFKIKGAKALVLGIAFKENCNDIRNSGAVDIVRELESFGVEVDVYDPLVNVSDVYSEYGITLKPTLDGIYDAIVLAVGHSMFIDLDFEVLKSDNKTVIYDIKSLLPKAVVTDRL